MSKTKKQAYVVKCTVNGDASKEESVVIYTTKPELARKKAEDTLRAKGFSSPCVFSCELKTE